MYMIWKTYLILIKQLLYFFSNFTFYIYVCMFYIHIYFIFYFSISEVDFSCNETIVSLFLFIPIKIPNSLCGYILYDYYMFYFFFCKYTTNILFSVIQLGIFYFILCLCGSRRLLRFNKNRILSIFSSSFVVSLQNFATKNALFYSFFQHCIFPFCFSLLYANFLFQLKMFPFFSMSQINNRKLKKIPHRE